MIKILGKRFMGETPRAKLNHMNEWLIHCSQELQEHGALGKTLKCVKYW